MNSVFEMLQTAQNFYTNELCSWETWLRFDNVIKKYDMQIEYYITRRSESTQYGNLFSRFPVYHKLITVEWRNLWRMYIMWCSSKFLYQQVYSLLKIDCWKTSYVLCRWWDYFNEQSTWDVASWKRLEAIVRAAANQYNITTDLD